MPRFFSKRAILVKTETVYGTDPTPTGVANAVLATNVTFNPSVGQDARRDLVLPYLGMQGLILVGSYATLTLDVEIAGSGAAGTPPAVGPLLRACGMSETIAAGVDAQYVPISAAQEAVTVYFNADGVQHILLGARGNMSLGLTPLQIPRFTFTLTGLLGTISDAALPAQTLTAWKKPVAVNKANTTFALHGLSAATLGVSIDLGNQIEPRFLIGAESIEHVERQMSGSVTMDAVTLAAKNWYSIAETGTTGALAAQHGTVAGNIVQLAATAVQIGRPSYGESQRIINNVLPIMLLPTAGNDEFKITFK